MKVSFIEVAGFRGFKDVATFHIPAGFAVLTGRNGAGKSTVFDAIEFALTGTISKFAVREAKGGGLQEHLWWIGEGKPSAQYVTIGFVDEAGGQYTITRTREGGSKMPSADLVAKLCGQVVQNADWASTLIQTTLIRDETIAAFSLDMPEQARFNAVRAAIGGLSVTDPTKRIQAIIAAADSALEKQKRRVNQAEAEVGRALSTLTELRSAAALQPDIDKANTTLRMLAPDIAAMQTGAVEALRRLMSIRKRDFLELREAFSQAEHVSKAERIIVDIAQLQQEVVSAHATVLKNQATLGETEALLEAERQSDRFAEHLVELLRHGEALGLEDGHCPLCQAIRSREDFAKAIADARARLSVRGERIADLVANVETATSRLRATAAAYSNAVEALRRAMVQLEARRNAVEQVRATYARNGIVTDPEDLNAARQQILHRQEQNAQLEEALVTLESSSAQERVVSAESRVVQLRKVLEDEVIALTASQRAAEAAKRMLDSARMLANQILTEQFDTILPLLKELYIRLRPHADWQEIELDFGGKVRASLNLTVGDGKNPQFLFSSGQRRAAGLAFLLAIHLSRPWCGLNTLLLDDPIQHIDDYRALNLVEVLAAVRKAGRQVVVAVEDPALADVLCRRLRSRAHEPGSRIEVHTAISGSAAIAATEGIAALPVNTMRLARAS